jgi:acyl-CoA thioester hydrolase
MRRRDKPHKAVVHELDFHIRFSEVDSMQIVWHGNYLKYFEDGREAFGAEYGMTYMDVYHHGFMTPLVKSSIEHKAPLKYLDKAMIKTKLIFDPSAKIIYRYEIYNSETNVLCATGETIQVFVDPEGELQLFAPEFFLKWRENLTWQQF